MILNDSIHDTINAVCASVGAAGRKIDTLVNQFGLDATIRNLPERKRWSVELVMAHHDYRHKISKILDEIRDLED